MTKLAYDTLPAKFSWKDEDGRLFIDKTPISKATVNPYWGSEIPDYDRLGWQADRQYALLRPPEELIKAAPSFNKLPVLLGHVHVTAEDPHSTDVKGATGESGAFEAPYLFNSMAIWVQDAIDGIKDGSTKEISCAYRYEVDPTPGEYEGQPYDGIMRNIRGNHVALVEKGRAGPDVYAWDHAHATHQKGNSQKGTAMATLNLTPDQRAGIAHHLSHLLKNKQLADGASPEAIEHALQQAEEAALAIQPEPLPQSPENGEITPQILVEIPASETLEPHPVPHPEKSEAAAAIDPVPAPIVAAMDSTSLQQVVQQALTQQRVAFDQQLNQRLAQQRNALKAAEQARLEVMPITGTLIASDAAYDSAIEIYALGLRELGVDLNGVHQDTGTYRSLFQIASQKQAQPASPRIAQDSTASNDFYQEFNLTPMQKVGAV